MWVWDWFESLSSEGKALIVGIVGALVKWWMDRRFIARLRGDIAAKEAELASKGDDLNELDKKLKEALQKLEDLKKSLRESESGIWTSFQRRTPFPDFDARVARHTPVVLTVANNKGGVGKTTLVGNLLAYFEKKKGLRVLAIDMDYQGSLSTMLRGERNQQVQRRSNVNSLLEYGADSTALLTASQGLGPRLGRSELVQAFYELALFEDRLMIEWLLQENDGDDIRYRLANVLLQPQVGQRYDVVLIDVPPRLSTGTMNALCCSTHVIVPTVFNPIAAEPVDNFLTAAKLMMSALNPNVQFAGILETMAPPRGVNKIARAEGRRVIQEALDRAHPQISILQSHVPQAVSIAKSGIAYLNDARARRYFDLVGDEISRKVGLQ